jgi:hypothetical protein
MKIIFKITIAILLITANPLSAIAQERTLQIIDRSYADINMLNGLYNVRLLPCSFGQEKFVDSVKFETVDKKDLSEIWLIYSGFSANEKFNQDQLNNKRIAELKKKLPYLNSASKIKWTDMKIAGLNNLDTAKEQFHGFVLVYDYKAEQTLGPVLDRHKNWDSIIVVVDVTTSMLPSLMEVNKWLDLNYKNKQIDRFVYFNDGDGIPDYMKRLNSTGGIHTDTSSNYSTYVKGIKKYMVMGLGNMDIAENVLEALIYAQKFAIPGSEIVLLSDNNSTPRDTALIDSLKLPVKVIACGVDGCDLNTSLINIAYRTGGSIHTGVNDVRDFKNAKRPKDREIIINIGDKKYITKGRSLKCVNCNCDPDLRYF